MKEQEQVEKTNLTVCTLSGTEEVGRNCNFIEFNNKILIIDAGLAFGAEDHPGIDYILPNLDYLKKNKHKIVGILLTHSHLDHIGALPWMLPMLDFPTVYAGKLTIEVVKNRLREDNNENKLKYVLVKDEEEVRISTFKARFIHVTHSVPDCFSIFIQTPKANIFVSGDFKMDSDPIIEEKTNYTALKKLRGKVDLALIESTNSQRPGRAKTEGDVRKTLFELAQRAKGRVVLASFASNVSRLYINAEIAKKTNRKLFLSGRSSLNMFEIAKAQNYLQGLEIYILPETELSKYPDDKILFACTGSQAEQYGALNRISRGEHKYFKIKSGDLVIRSSSDIPGNEVDIAEMTSRLIERGADLVNPVENDVHSSGHGKQKDLKIMYDLIQPRNVMPIHGYLTLRYFNKKNFIKWGHQEKRVLLTSDGQKWQATSSRNWRKIKSIKAAPLLIDGLGVGDTGAVVLNDRKRLKDFGFFIITLNLSTKNKKLIGKPKFMSRGFVYLKSSRKLLSEIEKIVTAEHMQWLDKKEKRSLPELKKSIQSKVSKHIYKQTEREPLILVENI
jgi:ribonuclease J